MPAPGRPTSEAGAVYTVEAAFAAILLISTMAIIAHLQPADPQPGTEDLRVISEDMLNILQYRGNLPGHPNLAYVAASQAEWDARAPELEADIRSMLPPGTRFYMSTPFGNAGDRPPEYAPKYVRPLQAFVPETNTIAECKLIVWRG